MATPITLYNPIDNYSTTLSASHTSGGPTITVTSVSGIGSPSTNSPVRLTAVRASDNARTHYKVTAVNGNVLTVATIDGYSDLNLVAGDAVASLISAASLADIHFNVKNSQITLAPHTIYASTIAGVVLDCDISNGSKIGGGSPTDNSTLINAVLATATATNPIHLVIDGGCAIGAPLIIPSTGHVTISGTGWTSGLFVLSGSNANAIQNFAHTDLANFQTWVPFGTTTGATTIAGHNVIIRDLMIHGNKGTYPNGNSNGNRDGTLANGIATRFGPTDNSAPDSRGPWAAGGYWLTGICLTAIDGLLIDNVYLYDTPSYHIDLYACVNVRVNDCRVDTIDPVNQGQTDGVHLNGGCQRVHVSGVKGSVGDDLVAINLAEGDGSGGGDIIVSDCHASNCASGVRVYGDGIRTSRILVSNLTMLGNFGQGVLIGAGGGSNVVDCNLSVWIDGIDFQSTTGNSALTAVRIVDNVGHVHLQRIGMIAPQKAMPMVDLEVSCKISSLVMADCHIHRNPDGNAAAYAFKGSAGCHIGTLSVDGFRVTEGIGATYGDIPQLFDFTGTTVDQFILDGSVIGVGTVISAPSTSTIGRVSIKDLVHVSRAGSPSAYSIVSAGSVVPVSVGRFSGSNLLGIASGAVSLTGPGLVSAGYPSPDALIANNTIYQSSDQGTLCYKASNLVKTINLVALGNATTYNVSGPGSGSVNTQSSNFIVSPNSTYTGTITITPSGGGLSTPIVQTYNASSTPQVFSITPTATGTVTLAFSNNGSLSNPGDITYSVSGGNILSDNFTGTAGSSLTNHVPAPTQFGSQVWTPVSGLSQWNFTSGGSGITSSPGSNGACFSFMDLTAASPSMTVTIVFSSTDSAAILLTQVHRDQALDFIEVDALFAGGPGGNYAVIKAIAGATTVVDNGAFGLSLNADHVLQYTLNTGSGNTIVSVKLDGTTVVSGRVLSDSAYQNSGLFTLGTESGAEGALVVKSITVA